MQGIPTYTFIIALRISLHKETLFRNRLKMKHLTLSKLACALTELKTFQDLSLVGTILKLYTAVVVN